MNTSTLTTTLTHPETAWLALSVPLWLTMAAILLFSLLLRGKLRVLLHSYLERRAEKAGNHTLPIALLWTPPIGSESQLLAFCLVAVLAVLIVLANTVPIFISLILAGPATALLLWLQLWIKEQQYKSALDHALPAAVGRLGAQLSSGSGIQPAIEKVVADLPEGPLKAEWSYIISHFGAPLPGGTLATPQQVVAALTVQTPSPRHATFLGHMEVALGQTHDVLIRRVQAAYAALHTAEQRRSSAATELAQMRYSGIAISLAGTGMAAYLALTQWKRFALAYQGPIGLIAGLIVGGVLLAPFLGGILLSRTDDVDY